MTTVVSLRRFPSNEMRIGLSLPPVTFIVSGLRHFEYYSLLLRRPSIPFQVLLCKTCLSHSQGNRFWMTNRFWQQRSPLGTDSKSLILIYKKVRKSQQKSHLNQESWLSFRTRTKEKGSLHQISSPRVWNDK